MIKVTPHILNPGYDAINGYDVILPGVPRVGDSLLFRYRFDIVSFVVVHVAWDTEDSTVSVRLELTKT